MGRRSRKRALTTRAERDAARREAPPTRRRSGSQRPQAPWGSFPLSELVILAGLVVLTWGFVSGGDQAGERIGAGLVLASLGGGELALREHLAGFRSHSSLLAGVAAFVAVTVVAIALGPVKVWVLVIVGVAVFGGTFHAMRELFKRRSGGLSFR
jgi:hypothetical protein